MEVNEKMTKSEILKVTKEFEIEQKKISKEKDSKIKEQDQAQKEMAKQIEDMQKMLIAMQAQSSSNKSKNEEPTFTVVSNLSGKNNISMDKDSTVEFNGHGSEEELTVAEIKAMVKFSKNKALFTNGILYFEEDEAYSTFKIKPTRILKDEFLLGLFELDSKTFLSELATATQNRNYGVAVHTIVYRMAYLYKDGQINNISKEIMDAFKEFFGISLFDIQLYEG